MGVLLVRVLILKVLRVVILRIREEYLENTLRARTRTRARDGKARHEKSGTRVTRGGKIIKKSTGNAHEKHGGITTEKLLIYY